MRLVNLMLRLGPFPSIYSKFCAWSGDSFWHLLLSWRLPPSGSCALFSVMRPGYIYFQAPVTQLIIWQMPNLVHYSSYAESQLLPTMNAMLNYVLKPTKHESFHGKYTGKKYLQVCQFLLLRSRLMTLSGSHPFEFANGLLTGGIRVLKSHLLRNCQRSRPRLEQREQPEFPCHSSYL